MATPLSSYCKLLIFPERLSMGPYYRPIVIAESVHPTPALPLAGGRLWFTHVERLTRCGPSEIVPVEQLPNKWKTRLCEKRSSIAEVSFDHPRIMGIVNVTPDSFSDGGKYNSLNSAVSILSLLYRVYFYS